MKKFIILLLFSLLLYGCIGAGEISEIEKQENGFFPKLTGIDLIGAKRLIPDSLSGKYKILTIAFERKQQDNVNGWIKIFDDIIAKDKNFAFYEIPLIYKINMPYRMWINNGMRAGIPDLTARMRTITVYTNREKFLELMNMTTEHIYTLILDEEGKILSQIQGDATKENITKLKTAINNL